MLAAEALLPQAPAQCRGLVVIGASLSDLPEFGGLFGRESRFGDKHEGRLRLSFGSNTPCLTFGEAFAGTLATQAGSVVGVALGAASTLRISSGTVAHGRTPSFLPRRLGLELVQVVASDL